MRVFQLVYRRHIADYTVIYKEQEHKAHESDGEERNPHPLHNIPVAAILLLLGRKHGHRFRVLLAGTSCPAIFPGKILKVHIRVCQFA